MSGIGILSSSGDLGGDRLGGAVSSRTMPRLKSSLAVTAKLVLTGGILLFVLRQVDLAALRETFARMNWALLALGLLQMLVIPFLGGVRWQLVLSAMGARNRIWPLSRLFWIDEEFIDAA